MCVMHRDASRGRRLGERFIARRNVTEWMYNRKKKGREKKEGKDRVANIHIRGRAKVDVGGSETRAEIEGEREGGGLWRASIIGRSENHHLRISHTSSREASR